MSDMTKSDIKALLDAMPDTPQNQGLIAFLKRQFNAPRVIKKPFTYGTSFLAAAFTAGTTITNNIAIQSDAPFLIQSQTYTADVAAAGQTAANATYPLANVLLTNTGSGDQMMNQSIPVTQVFGNGQFPYVLPEPKLLDARANLQVQANNRDAAQAYNLFLSFNGVKLFSYSE